MFSWLRQCFPMNKDDDDATLIGQDDALLWFRDLEKHSCGEVSFAVVQANRIMEDHSQVETALDATFVGVYDGHGGPESSKCVSDFLIPRLIKLAEENGRMSEGIIMNAFSATENAVIKSVERSFPTNRLSATVGSCCLVGVIWKGTLFVANLGDSRAVLGCVERSKKNLCFLGRSQKIVAKQLTMDQNADQECVRQELQSLHPHDPSIVVHRNGAWRVKGLIQKQISRTPEAQKAYLKNASSFRLHFRISRSIGDVYLKKPGFDPGPSHPRFHLPQPICQAVLRSDPSISTRILRPSDKFLIFASDGLWDLLPNQKAVEMVHSNPRMGIARRLLGSALEAAARKAKKSFDELKYEEDRRRYYDDITVIVVFIDHNILDDTDYSMSGLSLRGFMDNAEPSS